MRAVSYSLIAVEYPTAVLTARHAIRAIAVSARTETSLHLHWTPSSSTLPCFKASAQVPRLSVLVNGRVVLTDATLHVLQKALDVSSLERLIPFITNLVIPFDLWTCFARSESALRPDIDVTLLLDAGFAAVLGNEPYCPQPLHTLHLARAEGGNGRGPWVLPATRLQLFITQAVTPGSLKSVTLHGIVLVHDEPGVLASVGVEIRSAADLESPHVDVWTGDMKTDEAMAI
ncbi:hypothetical protein EXIGLDRAFT_782575 [Exidia glandulosa HHB12029]|uniref:Uncharacterized protein n=1 Tax=Exidia glandulosa HHB12029 TaxID=1314781 RepID=A0A166NKN3_EXIGL|nr:hypothetical protein EXIGLDRAFT_782575 [Exidia glandulosa HHB12029]